MRYAAAALAALLVAGSGHARSPEVVPWTDAAAHVGRIITVEGTVAHASVIDGACTMEFAADDPGAFRVVLVLGLFQAPSAPDLLYRGRRVRASGRVQEFQGRPEMIIRRADQIEVLDAPSTTTSPPPVVAPSPGAAAPAADDRCTRARARLDAARQDLTARSEDAARCLREGTTRCERERDAVARALEALPAREAEADSACR